MDDGIERFINSLRKTELKTLANQVEITECVECWEVPREEWEVPINLCKEHLLRLLHDLEQAGLNPRIIYE